MIVRPFPGSQESFLSAPATEVFYGGEAGGGKSFCLIIDALRYIHKPTYKAIIFRRSYPDLQHLIGEAMQIYKPLGATYKDVDHRFIFPSGAWIKFNHLNHSKDVYDHQGAQYDYIAFDELPQFPPFCYTYLFSRLRGIDPEIKRYMRSTGNPDGEHLLAYKARFIDQLKPNEIGWFLTSGDRDVKVDKGTPGATSRQWIPCVRAQNIALMKADPDYEARLEQLPEKQKLALKYGKWEQTDKPDQLIQGKWWERAISGQINKKGGKFAFGFDYAEMGSDHCSMAIGRGNSLFSLEMWPYLSHSQAATKCWDTFEKYGKYETFGAVDSVGPGSGVWTALQEMGLGNRIDPLRYKPEEYLRKAGAKGHSIQFNELRSLIWWQFAKDMEAGEIDLSQLFYGDAYSEHSLRLQTEILAITYKMQNGVLKVIPKNELRKIEHLGRSPDAADSVVYWNYARKRQKIAEPEIERSRAVTDYEPQEDDDVSSPWT